jgi:hypothetical protein
MKDTLSIFEFLHQNKLFPALKVFLNHLFVVSISSFLFETIYFKYDILDISDYKSIYNFFVKGDFVVPFALFFITWLITFLISTGLFNIINTIITKRLNDKYLNKKFISDEQIKKIEWSAEVARGVKLSEEIGDKWYIVVYNRIKESINPEQKRKIYYKFQKMQRSSSDDFIMIFRGFISLIIFFCIQEYFGWVLFSLVLICFIIYCIILIFIYQVAETLPVIINKIDKEISDLKELKELKNE